MITTDDWACSTITVLDAYGPMAGVDLQDLINLPNPPSFIRRVDVQELYSATGLDKVVAIEPGWRGTSVLPLLGTPAISLMVSPEDRHIVQKAHNA